MPPWLLSKAPNAVKLRSTVKARLADAIALAEAEQQRTESEQAFIVQQGERASHADEMARCAADPLYWFDHWAWTYDPRLIAKNQVPYVRFTLWPKQRDFITFLHAKVMAGEPFVLEKSRDQGATYLVVGYAIWRWLFTPGFKTTFCSRDEANVDRKGNADSIFEKMRVIYRRLPGWMIPEGFNPRTHDNIMQLTNPATGATVTGETGDNPGRGGRSTLYLVDEAAFLAHPQKVEAAVSGNADCIGWVSTPNPENGGLTNFFARKRAVMLPEQIFRLHYLDDPRKDAEWARKKKASLADPSTWDAEYEISYVPATEGTAIPYKWVQAAVFLSKALGPKLVRGKFGITGGDVGAGKAKSVCIHRFGPVVLEPERRQDGDTTGTAYWMLDCMAKAGTKHLNFDVPGVGAGVLSTLNHVDKAKYPTITSIRAVNTGEAASARIWPDERTSEEKFGNLKAEIWFLAREAFHRSFLHMEWMLQNPGGAEQKLDEIIVIPDDPVLQMQLATPKWFRNEKGKIVIETKAQLAVRHIPSPDDADAFVLSFLEEPDDPAAGVRIDVETFHRPNPFIVGSR